MKTLGKFERILTLWWWESKFANLSRGSMRIPIGRMSIATGILRTRNFVLKIQNETPALGIAQANKNENL
jgi:hypothetical protein